MSTTNRSIASAAATSVLSAFVDKANRFELPVAVHAHGADSIADARPLADRVGADRIAELFGRMRRMADHGVQVILGSDAGMGPFENFGSVLRNWSDWGFSTEEVIDMATVDAARALGLGSATGRLHPGFAADLLVVNGDPLTDLAALDRINAVLAQGRFHQSPTNAETRQEA